MGEFFEKIDLNKVLRYLVFMFLCLMAQNMVFGHIRPFGVRPMLLPAVAAAVGMFEGATWGPLFSLLMGYFADMSFVEHRHAGRRRAPDRVLHAPRRAGILFAGTLEQGISVKSGV